MKKFYLFQIALFSLSVGLVNGSTPAAADTKDNEKSSTLIGATKKEERKKEKRKKREEEKKQQEKSTDQKSKVITEPSTGRFLTK